MIFYRALKLIRQYHRLTQAELAKQLNVSGALISVIEKKGGKTPGLRVLMRYAAYCQMPLSSLLLFVERADADNLKDHPRDLTAAKAYKMLEWLGETTRPDEPPDAS